LKNTESLWEILYKAKRLRRISIIRAMRRAREGDKSASRIFEDALAAQRLAAKAYAKLDAKMAGLPENQRTEFPGVHIGYAGTEQYRNAARPGDIIKAFDQWIEESKSEGHESGVRFLKHHKIDKLTDLAATISGVLEDQKCTGLWPLRIEAAAYSDVTFKLLYEACHAPLRTFGECIDAVQFLHRLSKLAIANSLDLNEYQIAALSRRIAARLEIINRKGSR
jgi:hypothetical protein